MPQVEALATGRISIGDVDNRDFLFWVAALGSIRVTERPVEGLHSRINSMLRVQSNSSLAFISNELRFDDFARLIASNPAVSFHAFCKFVLFI